MITRFHADHALLPSVKAAADAHVETDVLIEVTDGVFTSVTPGVPSGVAATDGAIRLPGLTIPGLANAHSHAFHRALRGRTHAGKGSFWTWRDAMYRLADRLDPDTYYYLARAVYAEMAMAGITSVGEFHYLHHGAGGRSFDDPNAMGQAMIYAARDAGIRITLLDTLYLTAAVDGSPLSDIQRRFSDGTVDAWAERVQALSPQPHARIGVAAHSVRAVPAEALAQVVTVADGRPLHLHLSEQRAENADCLAHHGRTPTELLSDHGVLGPTTTAVHATHLTDEDRSLLGDTSTAVCFCPTTERDLADGIGPARALVDGGSPLCLGSDSHAVIDLFEEARAVEMHERLRTEMRGHFGAGELATAATLAGHRALGWTDAGAISTGARADLVTIRMDGPATAGIEPEAFAFAATAADVTHVLIDGRIVVRDGAHTSIDVGAALTSAIEAVTA
ncbi:MAG TPA: formimidoylglutamate deiminase [Micromonosporaceae bacterium]|jgi:formiminoglutamate deiminase